MQTNNQIIVINQVCPDSAHWQWSRVPSSVRQRYQAYFFQMNSHELSGFLNIKLAQDSFCSAGLCHNLLVYWKSGEGEKLCKSRPTFQRHVCTACPAIMPAYCTKTNREILADYKFFWIILEKQSVQQTVETARINIWKYNKASYKHFSDSMTFYFSMVGLYKPDLLNLLVAF